MPGLNQRQNPKERFFRYVHKLPSGCWLWTGKIARNRYGHAWYEGRTIGAHKFAWIVFRGPVPDGMSVLHQCDVPACVNPQHLFLGLPKDNTHDMITKGRNVPMLISRRGANSNFAKLTEEHVRQIRADRRRQWRIAMDYGVSQGAISLIKTGRNWKHLNASS